MLHVFYQPQDPFCQEIIEELQEMVVAHRLTPLSSTDASPYLQEGPNRIEGQAAIQAYVRELRAELIQQREVQSDACYIDPETGKVC